MSEDKSHPRRGQHPINPPDRETFVNPTERPPARPTPEPFTKGDRPTTSPVDQIPPEPASPPNEKTDPPAQED